jgi:hypothetical protein
MTLRERSFEQPWFALLLIPRLLLFLLLLLYLWFTDQIYINED